MLKQTDPAFDRLILGDSRLPIKEYGCLFTSLINAYCIYKKVPEKNQKQTFLDFFNIFETKNGFNSNGLVVWNVVQQQFNLRRYLKFSQNYIKLMGIDSISIDDTPQTFWIIELDKLTYTHFCNIVGKKGDQLFYFDVYDGVTKEINTKDKSILSIREIEFY